MIPGRHVDYIRGFRSRRPGGFSTLGERAGMISTDSDVSIFSSQVTIQLHSIENSASLSAALKNTAIRVRNRQSQYRVIESRGGFDFAPGWSRDVLALAARRKLGKRRTFDVLAPSSGCSPRAAILVLSHRLNTSSSSDSQAFR